MTLHFEEFIDDIDGLITFLTSDTWPYHLAANPESDKLRKSYENGFFTGEDSKTFFVLSETNEQVGLVRLFDLGDDIPVFDIRLLSKYRGMGLGPQVVNWLVAYVFNQYPEKQKLEAFTRQDNYAMRCVFNKCGFVKEAYHRKSWKDKDGNCFDSIGYGIIREDWVSGTVTPIDWNDFIC